MGMRDLSDVLWPATKVGILSGAAAVALLVVWSAFQTAVSDVSSLIGGMFGAIFFATIIGGPVILLSTAIFGAPAAILVDRLRLGRTASLTIVLVFAAFPILLIVWLLGNGFDVVSRPAMFSACFALPTAITLWRELMRKRQAGRRLPDPIR